MICTNKTYDEQKAETLLNEVSAEIYDKFNEIKTNPEGNITLSGARVILMDIFAKYNQQLPIGIKTDNPLSDEKASTNTDKINVQILLRMNIQIEENRMKALH